MKSSNLWLPELRQPAMLSRIWRNGVEQHATFVKAEATLDGLVALTITVIPDEVRIVTDVEPTIEPAQ